MKSWSSFFNDVKDKEYFKELNVFLDEEYSNQVIYPPRELMFNAFDKTPLDKVKVVIIGQDPYHEPGQAMGMAFSVPDGVLTPPSLINIYKEIENEYNIFMRYQSGDLTYLAEQGVLLLNAYLTVRKGAPLSHKSKNYEALLQDIMVYLSSLDQPIVYLLWGSFAQKFSKFITNKNQLILCSNHPSPLSANRGGWFGNNHFKLTNQYLEENSLVPIDWQN